MQKEKFIPGFDWFRLIGCVLVVATHFGFFRYFYDNYSSLYQVLSESIPVFFIISGYLCGREFSRQRAIKQAIRYGLLYFAIEISMEIIYFTRLSLQTGEIHLLGFLANVLRCFVLDNSELGWTGQLWFILALVYALILNAFMKPRTRRVVIVGVFILRIALAVIGEERITLFFEHVLGAIPERWCIFRAEELSRVLRRFLTGFLFTTIGFDIKNWNGKPVRLFLLGLPFAVFEVFVFRLDIAIVFLSIALFYWVKQLPGQFLRPYHTQISIFSVLMYFLHMGEIRLFQLVTDNSIISFLLLIVVNLVLTLIVCSKLMKTMRLKNA